MDGAVYAMEFLRLFTSFKINVHFSVLFVHPKLASASSYRV